MIPHILQRIRHLRLLEEWARVYSLENEGNPGTYKSFVRLGSDSVSLNDIYPPLRDRIVFYTKGCGWRLQHAWREMLEERRKELEHELEEYEKRMASNG